MTNYYRVLGISQDASEDERKSAYRQRARETHPDGAGDADGDDFKEVVTAYETLSDPVKRRAYRAEYKAHAKRLGYVVCSNCFAMVSVRRFSSAERPKCGGCKSPLNVTPAERDERYRDAFAVQLGELIQVVGVEGGSLARDAIRAAADGIRRKFGLGRS